MSEYVNVTRTVETEVEVELDLRIYEVRDSGDNDLSFSATTDSDGDICISVEGTVLDSDNLEGALEFFDDNRQAIVKEACAGGLERALCALADEYVSRTDKFCLASVLEERGVLDQPKPEQMEPDFSALYALINSGTLDKDQLLQVLHAAGVALAELNTAPVVSEVEEEEQTEPDNNPHAVGISVTTKGGVGSKWLCTKSAKSSLYEEGKVYQVIEWCAAANGCMLESESKGNGNWSHRDGFEFVRVADETLSAHQEAEEAEKAASPDIPDLPIPEGYELGPVQERKPHPERQPCPNSKYIMVQDGAVFKKGDIITLYSNDGSTCPRFAGPEREGGTEWYENWESMAALLPVNEDAPSEQVEEQVDDTIPANFENKEYPEEKEGTKYVITEEWHRFDEGDVVELIVNDDSTMPRFAKVSDPSKRQWTEWYKIRPLSAAEQARL